MEKESFDTSGLPGADAQTQSGLAGLPAEAPGWPPAGGQDSEPPRHNVRAWIELIVAIVLSLFLTLLLIGFVIQAIAPHPGSSRGGYIVSAVIDAVLLFLCGEWALHAEHRIRRARRQPLALSFEAGHRPAATAHVSPAAQAASPAGAAASPAPETAPTPAPAPESAPPAPSRRAATTPRARRRKRYGPGSMTFYTLLFVGLFIACLVAMFNTIADANRSSYVQQHGVRVSGTVTNVDELKSCGRYSCSYTAEITVRLAEPFQGSATTVVHYPSFSDLDPGQVVQVLVDPKQPGYAELPGSPDTKSSQWIGLIFGCLLFGALAVFSALELLRLLRRRREHRDALGSPTPAPA